jgi:integrase
VFYFRRSDADRVAPHIAPHMWDKLRPVRNLALGESGDVSLTPQYKNSGGRWVAAPRPQKATRWKARVYVRGHDGVRQEIVRFGQTRREAETALEAAVRTVLNGTDGVLTRSMPLVEAGEYWLRQISRPDSGLSARTIADYSWTWKYVDSTTSSLRGLTLEQANDPQRLRLFLQRVAEAHGSASAKKTKSVLHGVIGYAVDNGVLSSDAMRQVRTVTSTAAKSKARDHTRAMTRSERDQVIQATLLSASEPGLNPRTRRKRRATADLIAFLAGTGARIDEARRVRWQDVNLEDGRVYLRGTKSETSDRWLNLPDWLVEQLAGRAADCGTEGYVFAAPAQRDPQRVWDQSNSAGAVRAALDACGLTWAVPHTFRRTVATLLDQAHLPIARIADQLGHSDVSMTARVYLGRDLKGDKRDLARVL